MEKALTLSLYFKASLNIVKNNLHINVNRTLVHNDYPNISTTPERRV